MTWDETLHPRAAAGTFVDKPQTSPEASLAAPIQFVRTSTGVHRLRAATAEDAAREHTALTGEHAEPVEIPGTIAIASFGRIRVEYGFDDEGEDGEYDPLDASDTPFARVTIFVEPEGGDELEVESHSWCTRAPAYAEPRLFAARADQIAHDLGVSVMHGADPDEAAAEYTRILADMPDPAITPPQTAAEAAQIFRERSQDGLVLGWYVVNTRTTDTSSGPFISQRIAECHVPPGYENYRTQAGPVFLPGGTVAKVTSAPVG